MSGDLTEIQWKRIPGFPDYMVSNTGLMWSDKSHRLLRPSWDSQNQTFAMRIVGADGKTWNKRLARTILEAFSPPETGDLVARQRDGNPYNLRLENLFWQSTAELHRENGKRSSGPELSRKIRRSVRKALMTGRLGSKGLRNRMLSQATDPTYEPPTYD